MNWDERLIEAGVEIIPADAQHLRLRHEDDEVVMRLVRTTRRLHPSEVTTPIAQRSLLVAPTVSTAAAERARTAGWSLATDEGPVSIRFSDRHVLELPGRPPPAPAVRARPGRTPWGALAVVRRLLLAAPLPQTRLAQSAGISQARVSQVFDILRRDQLVRRTRSGWVPADWDSLCEWWLAHYPGPGGITTWWSGLTPPLAQATAALSLLPPGADAVLSGDLGADLIAPWRRPALGLVYANHGADLSEADLTPLASPEGATLALIVPDDPSVRPQRPIIRTWNDIPLPVADGLQILYDLHRSPGPDAAEAAAHWRTHLRTTADKR
ncbi:hypothetical protein [Saccharomonospora halophila]|uniref:hypothetical protein n=1 Tax=Saccharomonospora halophila TaxID=129922 RepID=UPI0012F93695|nr:hypothetical protein [Saccharomonospora halophila]